MLEKLQKALVELIFCPLNVWGLSLFFYNALQLVGSSLEVMTEWTGKVLSAGYLLVTGEQENV